jgi:fido (protein-threonine AMPylation protein)
MTPDIWRGVQKKGLLPGITSENYEELALEGMTEAVSWLLSGREKPPTLETAKKIHSLSLKKVVPFAGKVTKTQLITAGYVTCDPRLIDEEFKLLNTQLREGLPDNATPFEHCRWGAFVAAKWLRIHPFLDGHKRTISLWTITNLQTKFGEPAQNNPKLYKRLHEAFKPLRKGDLKPFGELLLEAFNIDYGIHKTSGNKESQESQEFELDWSCPHSIAPRQIESEIKSPTL